jgi:hypothetical protein
MSWKNLFGTVRGYVGLGTHSMRPDDLVVVFQGCSTAAVIRPWASGFKYVGAAYVDGIMDGEFWNDGSALDDEWFELI